MSKKEICNPLVSILVPLYNSELYIIETLESCISQTYKNIEVIVVNDGSTDRSLEVVVDYATKHSQVKVYSQPNLGACRARNFAFELSSGDYILYLDADDILGTEKIEKQIQSLISVEDKSIISLGPWQEFVNTTDVFFENRSYYHDYEEPIQMLVDIWSTGGYFQTSCYLCSREIIEKTGKWNESLAKNQDGEFFCRIVGNASRILFVEESLLYYRRGHDSISTANIYSEKKIKSVLQSYKTYKTVLLNKLDTKQSRKALARCYALVMCSVSPKSPFFKEAESEIEQLGVKAFHPKPSYPIKFLCSLIGLSNALNLLYYIKQWIKKLKISRS